MTNAELVAHTRHVLDHHHAFLREQLPPLEAALARADVPRELVRAVAALRVYMDDHMMKEEHMLFPRIVALAAEPEGAPADVEGPIRVMHQEHRNVAAMEHGLRGLLDRAGPHRDALTAVLDDLAAHAKLEDETIFAECLAREGVPEAERVPPAWVPPPPRPAARPSAPAAAPPPPTGGLRSRLKRLLGRG